MWLQWVALLALRLAVQRKTSDARVGHCIPTSHWLKLAMITPLRASNCAMAINPMEERKVTRLAAAVARANRLGAVSDELGDAMRCCQAIRLQCRMPCQCEALVHGLASGNIIRSAPLVLDWTMNDARRSPLSAEVTV